MKPDPTERTRASYDAVAAEYARRLPDTAFEDVLDLATVRRFVADVPRDGPGGERPRVLDAGCGTGRMSAFLRSLDASLDVVGMDLSPGMVAQARAAVPGQTFVEGDLAALPFPDGSWAAVLVWYSMIHVPQDDIAGVLDELARVTAPGGAVLIGFHAGSGERRVARAYGRDVDLVLQRLDPAAVAAALAAAGFEVTARLERAPRDVEHDAQAFVLVRRA